MLMKREDEGLQAYGQIHASRVFFTPVGGHIIMITIYPEDTMWAVVSCFVKLQQQKIDMNNVFRLA